MLGKRIVFRRPLVAAWAAALVAVAGLTSCSRGGGTNQPTSNSSPASIGATSQTQASGPTTTIPNVQQQLLSLSDLPAGWSVDNSPDSNSNTPKCLQNAKSTVTADRAKGEAKFQDGSNGVPFLEEDIVYQPGRAEQTMAQFSKVMAGCGHINFSDSGHEFTGTIGAMSFPNLGQQTEPYQINLSTTASGLTITLGLDLIAIRQNDEIAIVFYADLGTPDVTQVQALSQKAVSKMTAA